MDGSKPIDSHRSCGNLFGAHLPPPTSVIHRACAQQQLTPCRVLGDLRTIQERPEHHTRHTATSLHSFCKLIRRRYIGGMVQWPFGEACSWW